MPNAMEVLAPLDHRQLSNHSDWYPRYHHSAPLRQGPFTPRDSPIIPAHKMLSFRPEDRPVPAYEVPSVGSGSRQSPRQMATLPPIGSTKPSLPPIRSLLAEPLASPPTTPVAPRGTLQPLSHGPESEYTHQHKRSCSTLAWERPPSYASPASVHSASLPPLERSFRRDSVAASASSAHDLAALRQAEDAYGRSRLGPAFLPALRNPAYDRPASPERQRMPEPHYQRKRSYDSMSEPYERDPRMQPRPWNAPPHGPPSMVRPAYHPASPPPPPPFRPYSATGSHMSHAQLGPPMHAGLGIGSPVSGMYARPAVYDYHLSKARKRSNLPKESTDIMKRWFEAHLDNPYPSEEDKKHFAAEAGINLTQVSNWFINHRRRCPELKEQRDRKQTSGRRTASTSP